MDLFMEHLVQHKRTGKDLLITLGIVAAAGILLALSTIMLAFPAVASLWLIVAVAIIFFAILLIRRTSVEFEYILTNNELDIDKITAKSNRTRIVTINFSGIDICAPVTHSQFGNTETIVKTYNCTGDNIHGVYFVDFTDEKGRVRVLFQPPVSYIENVRRFNPSKIFVD